MITKTPGLASDDWVFFNDSRGPRKPRGVLEDVEGRELSEKVSSVTLQPLRGILQLASGSSVNVALEQDPMFGFLIHYPLDPQAYYQVGAGRKGRHVDYQSVKEFRYVPSIMLK
jgi:hypothetical protein